MSSTIHRSLLSRIGHTPLVSISTPEDCAQVLVKLETENPSGSMKDRMALAMIEAAEADGRLRPGGHVVEYTGGSTGVSLALICAIKGYRLSIVTSDAFSQEKRNHMAALGAELTIVESVKGGMDASLTKRMVKAAEEIAERDGAFLVNQLHNADQLPAYHQMGEEIWEQTGGDFDAFVQSTGTAASVRGISQALHRRRKKTHCIAVEPAESAVLSGGETGSHRIEGVGAGFVVPLWDPGAVDEIATVSTEDAMETARELAKDSGIFAGTSTGANLTVALEVGREIGPTGKVVTVVCDSGLKYLSTELYRDSDSKARPWR